MIITMVWTKTKTQQKAKQNKNKGNHSLKRNHGTSFTWCRCIRANRIYTPTWSIYYFLCSVQITFLFLNYQLFRCLLTPLRKSCACIFSLFPVKVSALQRLTSLQRDNIELRARVICTQVQNTKSCKLLRRRGRIEKQDNQLDTCGITLLNIVINLNYIFASVSFLSKITNHEPSTKLLVAIP